jgi:hypothetical protein
MCRCEQRRRREGPVDREDDRFASPEVFKHVGDAAGHCSMFGISSAVLNTGQLRNAGRISVSRDLGDHLGLETTSERRPDSDPVAKREVPVSLT